MAAGGCCSDEMGIYEYEVPRPPRIRTLVFWDGVETGRLCFCSLALWISQSRGGVGVGVGVGGNVEMGFGLLYNVGRLRWETGG